MKHLIKTQSGQIIESQCGQSLPKKLGTIWFSETDCEKCLRVVKTPTPRKRTKPATQQSLAFARTLESIFAN